MIQQKFGDARTHAKDKAQTDAVRGEFTITRMDILNEVIEYQFRCRYARLFVSVSSSCGTATFSCYIFSYLVGCVP